MFSNREWFEPSTADFWVVFLNSHRDRVALPSIALKVAEAVVDSPNPLVRVSVEMQSGMSLRVQINDLSKTENGVDFQGCIAALDVASFSQETNYLTVEFIEKFCGMY